ncbi:GNAT family N-acetyltransferase, partial [Klebsiella pneumoniae]|uniref:GNAT family N-acetyltransferase n=1 Tax=Klebsiella pneumoniae TaxID=573 RepID=UPI003B982854
RSSSDESLVGVVNLNEPVRGALQSAYLGYYVDKKRAGQGFMTEALHLSVEYAFQRLDFHRLEANIQPGNVLSIALVKRLGFR